MHPPLRTLMIALIATLLVLPPALADTADGQSSDGRLYVFVRWSTVDQSAANPTDCLDGCSLPPVGAGVAVSIGGYRVSGSTVKCIRIHWGDGTLLDPQTQCDASIDSCFVVSPCPFSHVYLPRATPYQIEVEAWNDMRHARTGPLFVCWTNLHTCGG